MFRPTRPEDQNSSKTEVKQLQDKIASNKLKQESLKLEIEKILSEIKNLDTTNRELEKNIKALVSYRDDELSEVINKAFFSYRDKGHHCIADTDAKTLSVYFYAPETTKERFIKIMKKIDKDTLVQADAQAPRGAVIVIIKLQHRDTLFKKLSNYDALQAIIDFDNERDGIRFTR